MTPGPSPWIGRARIVGPGRAGSSMSRVLDELGWELLEPLRRNDAPSNAATGVDLVIIATPDPLIGPVAHQIRPNPDALVIHLAGAVGVGALGAHPRRGALHPLVSMPDKKIGSQRLRGGAWFAIAADEPDDLDRLESIVAALGGRAIQVADDNRPTYHAAAVIASNHLVALLGQAERIAASAGLPLEPFLALASATLDGVATLGVHDALTGPVARGDWDRIAAHIRALDDDERPAYAALAEAAARLCTPPRPVPDWLVEIRAQKDGQSAFDPIGRGGQP